MSNFVLRWALKDIFQELTLTGYKILVWTFQPCHLWMRWTTTEPEEHLIPRIMRGLPLKSDKYFCFVNYEDNEQEEGGDTYLHTFIKEPWPHCETRWFYFHGTIDAMYSPSTSAIIKKHRFMLDWQLLILEPWTVTYEQPQWELIILEPWTVTYEQPQWAIALLEPWTVLPLFPSKQYVFQEPWGKTLTENNYWWILEDPDPPAIDLTNSILTLTFTGTKHSGIYCTALPSDIFLTSTDDLSLFLETYNTEVKSISPFQVIANMVAFIKNGQRLYLYAIIKRPLVGWGSGDYGYKRFPYYDTAWQYYGPGIHEINLLQFFYKAAASLGIDPDPSGWLVDHIEIAHIDYVLLFPSWIKNDYINLYHLGPKSVIIEPWTVLVEPPEWTTLITEPWTS